MVMQLRVTASGEIAAQQQEWVHEYRDVRANSLTIRLIRRGDGIYFGTVTMVKGEAKPQVGKVRMFTEAEEAQAYLQQTSVEATAARWQLTSRAHKEWV